MKKLTQYVAIFFIFLPISVLAQNKSILIIESYHAEYAWDASYKEGLNETLGDKYNLVYFEMDTKRVPKSEYEQRAEMAWVKYEEVKPVLVILGDDNAVKFLGSKFTKTETPVVYLGLNNNPRNYDMVDHKNVTGVLERPLLKRSIVHLQKLLPIKKVLILFDSGSTSQIVHSEVFHGKNSEKFGGITVDVKLIGNFEEWQKAVTDSKNQEYNVIIVGLYHTIKDSSGAHVTANTVLEWTSKNTPIPPFAFWDFSVGPDKATGGYVLFGKEQGKTAGEIALKILDGTTPGSIAPVIAKNGRFFFSKYQLAKWQITLPDSISSKSEYTD